MTTSTGKRVRAPWRSIAENSPDGILVVDSSAEIAYANPSLRELFGYREGELEGRRFRILIPERFRTEHAEHFDRYMAHPKARPMGSDLDLYGLRRDGTEVPIDVSLTPMGVRGEDFVVAVIRDTTDLRRTHRREFMDDKLNALRRLAGGVAHQFNNALTVIRGSADVVRRELQEDHEAREDIVRIEESVEQCRDLVRSLLAFTGRPDQRRDQRVDLGDVLRDMRPTLETMVRDDVAISTVVEDASLDVRIDPALIRQIVLDLFENADAAMPDGGRLRIVAERRRASEAEGGEAVALTVEDDGVGMSPRMQEKVFDPFFTGRSLPDGMGLGLSAVHGIVQQVGGRIEVKSSEGEGTRFTVCFPAVDREE